MPWTMNHRPLVAGVDHLVYEFVLFFGDLLRACGKVPSKGQLRGGPEAAR